MIVRRTDDELAKIDRACALVRGILAELAAQVRDGITTAELNALAEERTLAAGARPAFKGYHGYPASLCISVNDEVVHGIPSPDRVLRQGDIVGLDVGVMHRGFYGDAARLIG